MIDWSDRRVPERPRDEQRKRGPASFIDLLGKVFTRTLDSDLVARDEKWLIHTRLYRQLDMDGYRLRWMNRQRARESTRDGWEYVTVPYRVWWRQRVRRLCRPESMYLMKRLRAL